FPYRDASFDLAVAFSVFTHLLPEDMARYAAEAARVLRPGGTLCATFFLINSDVLAREGAWESRFDRDFGAYRVLEKEPQERALAYDEHHVRKVMRGCGFSVKGVRWGTWSGVADGPTYQDLLVARATGGHGLGRLVRRRRGRP
ncbi:MAG: class I SAM-dependent methyltransferase, partial [Gaiellaceae bacterium]